MDEKKHLMLGCCGLAALVIVIQLLEHFSPFSKSTEAKSIPEELNNEITAGKEQLEDLFGFFGQIGEYDIKSQLKEEMGENLEDLLGESSQGVISSDDSPLPESFLPGEMYSQTLYAIYPDGSLLMIAYSPENPRLITSFNVKIAEVQITDIIAYQRFLTPYLNTVLRVDYHVSAALAETALAETAPTGTLSVLAAEDGYFYIDIFLPDGRNLKNILVDNGWAVEAVTSENRIYLPSQETEL